MNGSFVDSGMSQILISSEQLYGTWKGNVYQLENRSPIRFESITLKKKVILVLLYYWKEIIKIYSEKTLSFKLCSIKDVIMFFREGVNDMLKLSIGDALNYTFLESL